MDATVWRRLRTREPGLAERWDELRARGGSLGDLDRLRSEEGAEVARFVSLQRELEPKRRAKFPDGRILFATSTGLEQATAAPVADHRAARFAAVVEPGEFVWDACSGVGGETVALLRAGLATVATDRSAVALRCAAANAGLARDAGTRASFAAAVADALRPPVVRARAFALFDPARRDAEGRRRPDPTHWSPPLGELLDLARDFAGAAVKLPASAAVAARALAEVERGHASVEWISVGGEMKELTLLLGRAARSAARRVVLLGEGTVVVDEPPAATACARVADAGELAAWGGRTLLEADVALWQADFVEPLAAALDLEVVAPAVPQGFLLGPRGTTPPPGFRAFDVLEALPLDRKRVRAALRARGIGPVTVKTRGQVPDADELSRRLRGPGEAPGWLVVTTVGDARRGSPRAVLVVEPRAAGALTPARP